MDKKIKETRQRVHWAGPTKSAAGQVRLKIKGKNGECRGEGLFALDGMLECWNDGMME